MIETQINNSISYKPLYETIQPSKNKSYYILRKMESTQEEEEMELASGQIRNITAILQKMTIDIRSSLKRMDDLEK